MKKLQVILAVLVIIVISFGSDACIIYFAIRNLVKSEIF